MISGPTHTTFHHFAHSQLLSDLLEIACDPALVLHERSAADHFEVLDLGQIPKQLILDAVSKVRVLLFLAQVFQRQYRDALFTDAGGTDLVGCRQSGAARPNPRGDCETEQK